LSRKARKKPLEVFLSHAAQDRKFVERLARVLADYGVKAWHGEHAIRGGEQWNDEIGAALERCDWMIVVLSPSSVRSRWVKREVFHATMDHRFDNRIIPVMITKCDPKKLNWVLPQFQMIIFTKRFAKACRELLRTWGIEYQP